MENERPKREKENNKRKKKSRKAKKKRKKKRRDRKQTRKKRKREGKNWRENSRWRARIKSSSRRGMAGGLLWKERRREGCIDCVRLVRRRADPTSCWTAREWGETRKGYKAAERERERERGIESANSVEGASRTGARGRGKRRLEL